MNSFNAFNRVVIVGNLVRVPELRTIPSGTKVCDFSIAVNDRIKKGEEWVNETTFVDCTAWDNNAEFLEKFAILGKPLLVEGRLKMEKWVDKQSGAKRSKLKVVAGSIVALRGRANDDDTNEKQQELSYETEVVVEDGVVVEDEDTSEVPF